MNVNAALAAMRSEGKLRNNKGKGDFGEDAVLALMHKYMCKRGGLLYKSFEYPYASNKSGKVYLGNIYLQEDGKYIDISRQYNDEIDILYVSPFRIYAVEVKSYHARMEVTIQYLKKNGKVDYQPVEGQDGMPARHKSPIWQAEKHARHLYHQIYDVLPDGNPKYIQPIVSFVDRCTVVDERSAEHKIYLPVTILNNLSETITDMDYPFDGTALDLQAVGKKLDEIKSKADVEYKQ
jgi:hypothetical protein